MRALLQLVCICLLMASQQGALTHRVWHLQDVLHEHAAAHDREHEHDDDGDAPQSALCEFHYAAGTVLGALDCAPIVLFLPTRPAQSLPARLVSRFAADAPPATSRGPPALF